MLWDRLQSVHRLGFPLQSRLHELVGLGGSTYRVWVKRDDELGGVMYNGSKLRKFASLLPALVDLRTRMLADRQSGRGSARSDDVRVGVVGGESSNNVLGLATLLRQSGFRVLLLLYETNKQTAPPSANCWCVRLLSGPDVSELRVPWAIAKDQPALLQWLQHEQGLVVWSQQAVQPVREGGGEADGRLAELLAVIPEGACCPEAVSGALSLAADLEKQLGLGAASSSSSSSSSSCSSQHATAHSHIPRFDHIFMDSGTGLTAAATIWAFRWLQGQSQANITLPHLHVMLNAGNTESFHQRLQEVQGWLPAWMRSDLLPANNHMSAAASFTLHAPSVGKSFGSAPSATLREVRRLVSEHGVWTEPVYSGKLFADGLRLVSQLAQKDMPAQAVAQTAETERELQDSERTHRSNLHRQCAGSAEPLNALFIHSGGVQSIFGFQHKLDRQQ